MLTAQAPAATAATPDPLRFTAGARERMDGVFYDETRTIATSSVTFPEAKVPVGNWLQWIDLLVTVTAAGNSASVAYQGDAPWSIISELTFIDAGGNAIDTLSGYNLFLMNLLGGFTFMSDPTATPFYVAGATGTGGTAGSFTFVLRVPVEIINRDAIGAYPNGASNAALRIGLVMAPSTAVYSTAPTALPSVNVKMISCGYVLPAVASPGGRPYSAEPRGAGTFQQWTAVPYDLTAGDRTITHTRKGNVYRTLILVARNSSGARSDSVITSLGFAVDEIKSINGPWAYLRHLTWQRQGFAAASLPTGVVQVSYAHDWDGKVGGELRDMYVPTQPGSKVEIPLVASATSTLTVITNEIVTRTGAGVVRI